MRAPPARTAPQTRQRSPELLSAPAHRGPHATQAARAEPARALSPRTPSGAAGARACGGQATWRALARRPPEAPELGEGLGLCRAQPQPLEPFLARALVLGEQPYPPRLARPARGRRGGVGGRGKGEQDPEGGAVARRGGQPHHARVPGGHLERRALPARARARAARGERVQPQRVPRQRSIQATTLNTKP